MCQVLLGQKTGDLEVWRRHTLSMRLTRVRDVLVRLNNPLTLPRWGMWRVTQAEGTACANPYMELDEFSEGLIRRKEWQETRSCGGPCEPWQVIKNLDFSWGQWGPVKRSKQVLGPAQIPSVRRSQWTLALYLERSCSVHQEQINAFLDICI